MTANELADELENAVVYMSCEYEAATMLRQQTQEIEQLKERLEETCQLYIKQLAITHYDTQSHPKPVAMMYKDKLGTEFTSIVSSEILKHPKWTPLYTHPMRELTDEEIMQTLNGIEYSPAEVETSFDYEIRIARAILKKASEK